ncbi:Cullin-2 [Desmophyllum pertusum]|uniref:Cullin-2 n=1 Tax=Desmophyllum pertusum TaxID=174260 RepID=A0A9W9ZEC0_9CNID|nr:Cullin-2 [Desmophyllum pertusum]
MERTPTRTLFMRLLSPLLKCSSTNQKGALHLYEEVLEKPLLNETKAYYRREAAELHADNTCHAFIAKVDIRIQDEDLRTRKFFHPVSYSRVVRECEARMVEDYIPYLQENVDRWSRRKIDQIFQSYTNF